MSWKRLHNGDGVFLTCSVLVMFETFVVLEVGISVVSVLQTVSDKLMAGFVECLDNEEAEEGTEKGDGETDILLSKNFTNFCVSFKSCCFNTMTAKPVYLNGCIQTHPLHYLQNF